MLEIPRILLSACALAVSIPLAAQSRIRPLIEPTSFCDWRSDGSAKMRSLPPAVVTAIANMDESKEMLKDPRNAEERRPEKLLQGARVRLTNKRETLFVVMGTYPLSGADNTWFWVVRSSGSSADVLLFTGANCLRISRSTSLGYRDIVTTWASAATSSTESYKFNGTSYELRKSCSKPNSPFNAPVECKVSP